MKEDKEKYRLYGQIIENFVNAQTINESWLVLFKGIQKAFTFSSEFVNKAESLFTVKSFTSEMTGPEKALLKFFVALNIIKKKLPSHIYDLDKKLDALKKKVDVLEDEEYGLISEFTLFLKDLDNSDFDHYSRLNIDKVKSKFGQLSETEILNIVKRLQIVGSMISELKKSIPESKFSEIKSETGYYQQLLKGNGKIAKFKQRLRLLLLEIINEKNLYQSEIINDFLNEYNRVFSENAYFYSSLAEVNKNGVIIERPQHTEDAFLIVDGNQEKGYIILSWPGFYYSSIVRFVIKFLKSEKNKKRIIKCAECGSFHISKTIRPSRFCSDECRHAWNNRKRIESGEAREYKRKKRAEGAKESYYG